MVVLMIIRFDKNYTSGPVGDSSGWSGKGDGDFLGMVRIKVINLFHSSKNIDLKYTSAIFGRELLSAMPSSSPASSSTTSLAAASPSLSSSSTLSAAFSSSPLAALASPTIASPPGSSSSASASSSWSTLDLLTRIPHLQAQP